MGKIDGLHVGSFLVGVLVGVYAYKWKVAKKY